MKTFCEYLNENKSNSLVVFDIDDTLFDSEGDVWVKKDGRRIKKLSKGNFDSYKLKPNEEKDFSDFMSSDKFANSAKPIKNVVKIAKTLINRDTEVAVITARPDMDDKETFLDVFRKSGIKIDKSHVYRAGNLKKPTPQAKVHIIQDLISKKPGFTSIYMFDDSNENLVAFKKLKSKYPDIVLHAMLVKDGKIYRS